MIKIQTALYDFDIKGEANLQNVCNEILGAITTKSSQNPSLFKRFLDSDVVKVVGLVSSIVTLKGGFTQTPNDYQYLLKNAVVTFIENFPDKPTNQAQLEGVSNKQSLLEASPDPQEMEATIDESANHKVLSPSGEEE